MRKYNWLSLAAMTVVQKHILYASIFSVQNLQALGLISMYCEQSLSWDPTSSSLAAPVWILCKSMTDEGIFAVW